MDEAVTWGERRWLEAHDWPYKCRQCEESGGHTSIARLRTTSTICRHQSRQAIGWLLRLLHCRRRFDNSCSRDRGANAFQQTAQWQRITDPTNSSQWTTWNTFAAAQMYVSGWWMRSLARWYINQRLFSAR